MTLQEKCKEYLKEKKLTQKEFCIKYECDESMFSRWLNNKKEYKKGEKAAKKFIETYEKNDIVKLTSLIKSVKISYAPKERKDREGIIYIMQIPGEKKVKIGRTIDIKQRLRHAKTFSPEIEVIHQFLTKDYVKAENFIHELLSKWRDKKKDAGNEWFTCEFEKAILACVKAITLIDSLPLMEEEE